MRKHLNSFNIYITVLLISILIFINQDTNFENLHYTIYIFIHITIIYLSIYFFKIIIYFIYFIIGIILDIFILNEIGPHLLVFIFSPFLISHLKKYLKNLSSVKIAFFISFFVIFCLFFEMLFTLFLFNINLNFLLLFKGLIILSIVSYPVFFVFNKIDKIK